RGEYRRWSLRGVPEPVLLRWFEPRGARLRIAGDVRSLVFFERKNLVDAEDPIPPDSVDILFCRNVLIYFDDQSITKVLRMLEAALRPAGTLVVASAEVALLARSGLA